MRLRFNIGQLMLLTALAGLVVALLISVYGRARSMFQPEAVSYSPDGESLAAMFSDGTVTVWNRQGQQLGEFDAREAWISLSMRKQMQLTAAGHVVVIEDGRFDVWNTKTGTRRGQVGTPTLNTGNRNAAISGDGTTGVTVQPGARVDVDIYNLQTGERIKRMPPEVGHPLAVALSEDGTQLATVSYRSEIEVWDIASEQRVAGPYEFSARVLESEFAFSTDLRVAAVVQPDRFDVQQGQPIELLGLDSGQQAIVHSPDPISGLQLSPDGTLLATRGARDVITFIDTSNGDQRGTITPAYRDPVFQLPEVLMGSSLPIAFSPDGTEVLIGSNAEVAVYDVATGQLKKRLWGTRQSLGKFFFGPTFVIWAVFWGLARRRQRISEATTHDDTVEAEIVPNDQAAADSDEPTSEPTTAAPPQSLMAAWILLLLGGMLAIGWAMFIIFNQFTCCALTPMPYFSLYSGLVTVAAAAGRRTDKLPMIYSVQMGNIICFDLINFTLGIAGLVLAHRPAAKAYTSRLAATR